MQNMLQKGGKMTNKDCGTRHKTDIGHIKNKSAKIIKLMLGKIVLP